MGQLSAAREGRITSEMQRVAQREGQSVQSIREELAAGIQRSAAFLFLADAIV